MSEKQSMRVSDDESGGRLDRLLIKHFPQLKFVQVQKLIRTGQIRLDGKRAKPNQRINAGEEIRLPPFLTVARYPEKDRNESDVPNALIKKFQSHILFEDDQIIVLNKWAGLAVQGGSKTKYHVDSIAGAIYPQKPKLTHRIDKDTTGILVLAKTAKSAAHIARAFSDQEVEKVYWAVVCGSPKTKTGTIDLPMVKKMRKDSERVEIDHDHGEQAITKYRVIDGFGRDYALLELCPLTGRTHQLRVHCAAIGVPILGDKKYGDRTNVHSKLPKSFGLHLHARKISFSHLDGQKLGFTAPVSDQFENTLAMLNLSVEN